MLNFMTEFSLQGILAQILEPTFTGAILIARDMLLGKWMIQAMLNNSYIMNDHGLKRV